MTTLDPFTTRSASPTSVSTRATGIALAIGATAWGPTMSAVGDHEGFDRQSVLLGITALVFQCAIIALLRVQYRTRAMGPGRVARIGYRIQLTLMAGAVVSTILDTFWLIHGSVVWAIFDVCWPLSMLGMVIIGIRIAVAGRWTGALRWHTLFAQSWFFWALPLSAIPGIGFWGGAVQTILGYGLLGVLLARRGVVPVATET